MYIFGGGGELNRLPFIDMDFQIEIVGGFDSKVLCSVEVSPCDTVADLKDTLELEHGFGPWYRALLYFLEGETKDHRAIFSEGQLEDDKTLDECGISPGSVVYYRPTLYGK